MVLGLGSRGGNPTLGHCAKVEMSRLWTTISRHTMLQEGRRDEGYHARRAWVLSGQKTMYDGTYTFCGTRVKDGHCAGHKLRQWTAVDSDIWDAV